MSDTLEWIHSVGNKLNGFRGHWKCRACGFADNCVGDSFCSKCNKHIDECIQEGYWDKFYHNYRASSKPMRITQCVLCDGYGCGQCRYF